MCEIQCSCKEIENLAVKNGNLVKSFIHFLFPGQALNFLLENSFTEEAGSRKDFPSVLVVITDGKSEDPVEKYAKKLRSRGVEVFVLGAWSHFLSYIYKLQYTMS